MPVDETKRMVDLLIAGLTRLVLVNVLSIGLMVGFMNVMTIAVVYLLLASSVGRPSETRNVQIQESPMTREDNIRAVLRKRGEVE